MQFNAGDYRADFILIKSLLPHQKSALHQRSLALETEEKSRAERAMISQSEATPAAPASLQSFAVNPTIGQTSFAGSLRELNFDEADMWAEYDAYGETFDAGDDPEELARTQRKALERQIDTYGVWGGVELPASVDHADAEMLWEDLEYDEILTDVMRNTGPSARNLEEHEVFEPPPSGHAAIDELWSPYPSKLMFLLDMIDHLPRLRISSSLMKVILWLLREAGNKNVPSFYALRSVQKKLREESCVPTIHWMSPKGTPFSFNDPRSLIANDWSNPSVCSSIQRYAMIPPNGVISEVWHAEKWRHDVDRHVLSPMYDDGNRHFFIDEPARLKDGSFVIPLRWLEDSEGKIWAEAWQIGLGEDNCATICDDNVILISGLELMENMLDLQDLNAIPLWSRATINAGHPTRMPNPDRALAEGDPIYTSFIDVFGDDVSGNRSKSWNKHWNTYISHRNLPRKLLQQQYHTHFVSTSTHASIPEQFQGIKEVIETTHCEPVKVRHGITGKQIRFKIYCNCGPGDNPAQSEASGHIGGNGNHPCRKCDVGGSQKDKETDEGFHKMFLAGNARSAEQTLAAVEDQVKAACLGVAQTVKNLQSESGIKDAYTQSWIDALIELARNTQKAHPARSTSEIQAELMIWVNHNKVAIYNAFLTLEGFDVARDTPVEILHTILLGLVKYLWHGSHTSWTPAQKKIYSTRLQGTDTYGLSIHPIRADYIMQYANSLIGRQLKTLAQVNVFHVYDLVEPTRFALTKAVGELTALLWFTEIRNMNDYLADVDVAASNVLDIAALIDPSKLVAKIKYHLLSHLREDIIRFGPLVGVATETFECFNAVFRYCSILSNHLTPSRDIAYQLAHQEVAKHTLSGGWWTSPGGKWMRSGSAVRQFMGESSFLQALYGWPQVKTLVAGTVHLKPQIRSDNKKRLLPLPKLSWAETAAARALNQIIVPAASSTQWHACKNVIAESQDECKPGAWVFARSPLVNPDNIPVVGRIIEIIQAITGGLAIVILDVFQISGTRHELFGMPVLARRHDEAEVLAVPSKYILFQFNAQHDCHHAKCTASGERPVMQERTASRTAEKFIVHNEAARYILNTHALHNAHLIRAALPRDLTVPLPYALDRTAYHHGLAQELRLSQNAKRAKTAEKRKANATERPGSKRRRIDVDELEANDDEDV
ncbi:hypothetical protein B0H34DRAFT_754825 [Crassisporium funariophilum]|nr:hypothetical protein B0H34DRAFT_754767 [Crassisporium funariophilum]KAF8153431.1 hypothetical protein B0H34DRAFT_754825 [Crassisporium funariophilum]